MAKPRRKRLSPADRERARVLAIVAETGAVPQRVLDALDRMLWLEDMLIHQKQHHQGRL